MCYVEIVRGSIVDGSGGSQVCMLRGNNDEWTYQYRNMEYKWL